MPSISTKRPRPGESMRGQPKKKLKITKKQRHYHSSSEDDTDEDNHEVQKNVQERETKSTGPEEISYDDGDDGVDARDDFDDELAEVTAESDGDDSASGSGDSLSETSTNVLAKRKKRQDPEAFASSISKILGSKLTTSKRADPVLSRSRDAALATKEISEAKLEAKAKNKIKEEKRAALDKGRVKDVLALEDTEQSTAQVLEEEKKLKKIAQRGVIKLFNAVRAAQVKGDEAARQARESHTVGIDKRTEMASEMSKQGFLDLIASGGKKTALKA